MLFIAHRGLIHGPNLQEENKPETIRTALEQGFYAEVDVWLINNTVWLGHDLPTYKVEWSFLIQPGIIAHAKNLDALKELMARNIHCFWHENDAFTLTSRGWVWAFPNSPANGNTVCVMPEVYTTPPDLKNYRAVCTDYVIKYKEQT